MDLLQYDAIGAREFTPAAPHRDPNAEEVAGQDKNHLHSIFHFFHFDFAREEGFDLQESVIRCSSSSSGQKIMAIRRLPDLNFCSTPFSFCFDPFSLAMWLSQITIFLLSVQFIPLGIQFTIGTETIETHFVC